MNGNAIESEITMDMLKDAVENNRRWRASSLNLNAAESLLFEPFCENVISGDLSRRAVLGRPGNRYSEGGKYIDIIENITDGIAKELFESNYSEWRAMSASVADGILIHALTHVGDKILATPSPIGHPTWHEKGYAGFRGLKITDIPFDWSELDINYEQLSALTSEFEFSLGIHGSSLILFPPDFNKLIKALNGIPLWYDGAHVMGLIAAGIFPNPSKEGATVLSGSTQKTLSGPLGGLILTNSDKVMDKIDICTSNDTATPDYGRIAALAAGMIAWKARGRKFSINVVSNARSLAQELNNLGIKVLMEHRGYTSTHQIAIIPPGNMEAHAASARLSLANIITTPFPLPDGNGGTVNVLRMGTTEITGLGMVPEDMHNIANAINASFTDSEQAKLLVKKALNFR